MLSVQNLSVSYGAILALQGVNLEVPIDGITSIIGANGAGKTSLLSAISGLIPYRCDSLTFCGEPVPRLPHRVVQAGIIHVPEGRQVFANMSVEENLWMGAYRRRDMASVRSQMEEVYEVFPRLRERRNQIAATLSGGEQQMLALGRGLMAGPRLLLLDEPSLGLAPNMVDMVFEVVQRIARRGVPVLLVEQNAAQALAVARRAYVLETGRVVLSGTGVDLLQEPRVRQAYLGMEE
ncbi:MAG: ABC transporter ATP-binding protein [Firmicutes bacterium]|nr:ABC transporter ATP-binding protein [Bacillota bacterium]